MLSQGEMWQKKARSPDWGPRSDTTNLARQCSLSLQVEQAKGGTMTEVAIVEVDRLFKIFRKPFTGKKVVAVGGVTFSVARGDIFGFLGPNGAGKTTTIKMITGLVSSTSGEKKLFGVPAPAPKIMGRVGFLPENPYIYPYLTPREFVNLCGSLNGLHGKRLV